MSAPTVTITLPLDEAREVLEVLRYSALPTMEHGGVAVNSALLQVRASGRIRDAIEDATGEASK